MELKKRYMSKKDFGDDKTNVEYALYVRENLKPGDYFKTNTGEIFKSMTVSPILNGKVYYANGDYCWVNESAINNFSPNLIDLIEPKDIVVGKDEHKFEVYAVGSDCVYINGLTEFILIDDVKEILTHENFESMAYEVGD